MMNVVSAAAISAQTFTAAAFRCERKRKQSEGFEKERPVMLIVGVDPSVVDEPLGVRDAEGG